MAKAATQEMVEEPMVDLSPEAEMVRRNLQQAAPTLLDQGRIQAIVEEYRSRKQHLDGVVDNRGNPIPIPLIVAVPEYVSDMDAQLIPIIQDCCEDAENRARAKVQATHPSKRHGAAFIESLATALAPLRNRLTVPPVPSRS